VNVPVKLSYARLVLSECRAFVRGRQRRTQAQIIEEYGDWRVNLQQPVLAVHPDGRLERTRVGDVRARNWRRIVEGLGELGVTGGTVLEVGGGDGTNIRGLRESEPRINWIACDLVPRNRAVVQCDATKLPFDEGSLDAVITYNALEQMPREVSYQAMKEIARVSRAGVVSVEPDYERGRWPQKLAMIRKDYIRDIVAPATAAGLELVRREWTIGGNPMNRPSLFIFRKSPLVGSLRTT